MLSKTKKIFLGIAIWPIRLLMQAGMTLRARTKRNKALPLCHGIRVVYDPTTASISDSRGLWRWKQIVVGNNFFRFPPREQQAILLHEVGHCKLRHLEKRILSTWLVVCAPRRLMELCVEQEFEADRYAAAAGFGEDLARAFSRIKGESNLLHPPLEERRRRLVVAR